MRRVRKIVRSALLLGQGSEADADMSSETPYLSRGHLLWRSGEIDDLIPGGGADSMMPADVGEEGYSHG